MRFAKGLKAPIIAPHLHRVSFRMHAAARVDVSTLPRAVDLRDTGLVAPVKNQGPIGSCNPHRSSSCTSTALALAGTPLDFTPSEDDLYKGARSIERARNTRLGMKLPPLTDDGSLTDDILFWMAHFGIRPRKIATTSDGRNSDCEESTANDEETLSDVETDAQRLFVGPYAVDPLAADAEDLVKAALAARIPVAVDEFVDTAFEDWAPGRPPVPAPNTQDPNGGGHAIFFVAYTPDYYVIRNSWDVSWGDGGDARVSSAWLRDAWGLVPWTVRAA